MPARSNNQKDRRVSKSGGVKKIAWLIGFAGILLFVAVVSYQGIDTLSMAVAAVGWGLLWITLFHLVPMVVDTYAWNILLDKRHRVGILRLTWITWIGEAVNSLLPVALIGGGLVRVRLLSLAGIPSAIGGASVVADITAVVVSLIVFSCVGVALLGANALPGHSPTELLLGLFIFSLVIYGFYAAQRRGLFFALARRFEGVYGGTGSSRLSHDAAELDRRVGEIYERRRDFWLACFVRLLGWLAGVGEVWLALHYLNAPVTIVEAVMLESLGQAIRSAAFAVPGALGIQEGAYLVLSVSIGIPPETGVALSLVKRIRELSLGVPALLVWQRIERRRFGQRQESRPYLAGEVD